MRIKSDYCKKKFKGKTFAIQGRENKIGRKKDNEIALTKDC